MLVDIGNVGVQNKETFGYAKFHSNPLNESPLQGKKPQDHHLTKRNTNAAGGASNKVNNRIYLNYQRNFTYEMQHTCDSFKLFTHKHNILPIL